MGSAREVVVTGVGVVSPIGIGRDEFWQSLREGRSGVGKIAAYDGVGMPVEFGAEVGQFDPKQYVTPRKSLKVMSREIQFAFAAAELARADAGLDTQAVDPDRFGVVFGSDMIYVDPAELQEAVRACMDNGKFAYSKWGKRALGEMYPLWMLKYLPNMPACHIAIAQDARGPNNSILLSEASSLAALAEAMRTIERGQADVVITGGTGSRIHPMSWVFRDDTQMSHRAEQPAAASRPFDAGRDGVVYGEGAASFIVESRQHAESRGARVQARVLSYGNAFERPGPNRHFEGTAIRHSIRSALAAAHLEPSSVGHVNAHGLSTVEQDLAEAAAIRDILADVPVTAPKSFFGNLGAGTGAVEMAASVIALRQREVPFTLNYQRPDSKCPISVVRDAPLALDKPIALLLNQTSMGQSMAVVIAGP